METIAFSIKTQNSRFRMTAASVTTEPCVDGGFYLYK